MIMATQTMWSCRDTIQYNDETQYPVQEANTESCWDIVSEVDAYSFNVCTDCLVYVDGQENSILSQREIQDILTFKGIDFLSGGQCKQLTNAVSE